MHTNHIERLASDVFTEIRAHDPLRLRRLPNDAPAVSSCGRHPTGRLVRLAFVCAASLAALSTWAAATAAAASAATPNPATVQLSAHVEQVTKSYTVNGVGGCGVMVVLVVAVPPGVGITEVSVVQKSASGGPGTLRALPLDELDANYTATSVTYGNLTFPIGKGQTVYGLGYGGGPGKCGDATAQYTHIKAIGVRTQGQLSGHVTDKCGSAVAGATVSAVGSSSGSATTLADGSYSMTLTPGSYSVSASDGTLTVAPPKVGVSVGGGSATANFVVQSCRGLKVVVKKIGSSRSGLGIYRHFAGSTSSKAFFRPEQSKACVSGCTNILVTVTNPKTGAPVPNATIESTVNDITGVTGSGFLCNEADDCGRSVLLNTFTDDAGQVRLLYWSPGLIQPADVTVNVLAKCVGSCSSGGLKQGSGKTSFTVKPYLIYQHTGDLSDAEATELAEWASGQSVLAIFGNVHSAADVAAAGLQQGLDFLVAAEIAAEKAEALLEVVEAAEPIVGVLQIPLTGTELWERQGFIATLVNTLDLSTIGLDDSPFERMVSGAPSLGFENKLANYGTVAPLNAGADGYLWQLGTRLAYLQAHNDPAFGSQSISLDVYEVSYCDDGKNCGPGYFGNAGIQPELYFVLNAAHGSGENTLVNYTFTLPYDPNAWTESQHNLKGVFGG